MTKRNAERAATGVSPDGSRVRVKSLFFLYSSSLRRMPPPDGATEETPSGGLPPGPLAAAGRRLGMRCRNLALRADGSLAVAALLEAFLETGHEVDHLRVRRLAVRLLEGDLLSLHLRADDLHQVRAIFVGVL